MITTRYRPICSFLVKNMTPYEESILTLSMLINSKGYLWNEADRKSFFQVTRQYILAHPEERATERVSNGMNTWVMYNEAHPISEAYFEIPPPDICRSEADKALLDEDDAMKILDGLEKQAEEQFNSQA